MTETYRWNKSEAAAGYDAAAEHIHPHYLEIQAAILGKLRQPAAAEFLLVDLGGGSGRLALRFLQEFPNARVVVIDQSEAFLDLARARLEPYGERGRCLMARLQDDWRSQLDEAPAAITSMSAIHHLSPAEKRAIYQQAFDALRPGGVFLNGDEFRDPDDRVYLSDFANWTAHVRRQMDAGRIHEAMFPMLETWERRDILTAERKSGDDWQETMEAQLGYLHACGFRSSEARWKKDMWTIFEAVKG